MLTADALEQRACDKVIAWAPKKMVAFFILVKHVLHMSLSVLHFTYLSFTRLSQGSIILYD